MRSLHQKRMLRSLAAATLLVWMLAQVFCFLHCNFGGNQSWTAHYGKGLSAEKACCASQNKQPENSGNQNATAVCLSFKTVAFNENSPLLPAPTFTLMFSADAFQRAELPTVSSGVLRRDSFSEFSAPPISLLKPTVLNLPPPAWA